MVKIFEEQLTYLGAMLPTISTFALVGIAISILAGIIFYVAYYMTYNRIIIIKERVGKEFDIETHSSLVDEKSEKKFSGLAGLAGSAMPVFSQPIKKKLQAVPTTTKIRRGKIIKFKGKYYLAIFRFLAAPMRLKTFGGEFWNFAGSNKRLELMKLSERIYAPIVTIFDEAVYNMAAFDENYIDWVVNDIEEDKRKFHQQGWWERYGTWVMTSVTMIICLIFVIIVFQNLQPFADAGARGAEAIGSACSSILEQNI